MIPIRFENEKLEDYIRRYPKSEILDVQLIGEENVGSNYTTEKSHTLISRIGRLGLNLYELGIICGGGGFISGYFKGKGYTLAAELDYLGIMAPTVYVGLLLKVNMEHEQRRKIEERLENILKITSIRNENLSEEKLNILKEELEKKSNKQTNIVVGAISAIHLGLNYGTHCFGLYIAKKC